MEEFKINVTKEQKEKLMKYASELGIKEKSEEIRKQIVIRFEDGKIFGAMDDHGHITKRVSVDPKVCDEFENASLLVLAKLLNHDDEEVTGALLHIFREDTHSQIGSNICANNLMNAAMSCICSIDDD